MLVLLSHPVSIAISMLKKLDNSTLTFLKASALWRIPSYLSFIGLLSSLSACSLKTFRDLI
jgi:hypothetical protein